MRLSLRTQILLLITGIVTGLATIILVVLALLTSREINRTVQRDVRATGGALTQFLRERSERLQDQSLLLARLPVVKASIQTNDPATVTDSARDCQQQMHTDAVVMTDRDGRILGASDQAVPIKTNAPASSSEMPGTGKADPHLPLSEEPGVQAALRRETWTGVVPHSGRLMVAVSVPVMVQDEVWGTFTAYSVLDARLAADLKSALGSEVAFVYRGQVVGASLRLPDRLPTPQGTPRLIAPGGARYFALYAPLPNTRSNAQMGFVVLLPYARAMATLARVRWAFAGVSALALVLALAAGATVARGLTRPLDGLVQAARVVSAGGWPDALITRRRDEIGLLQNVFNEMTARMKASQERLLALIDTDPLTGLDNHRRFQERLIQETHRCAASGEALSLLLFDLDHFQDFNQRRGHAAGDEALQTVATILTNCLPEVAISARYGGEEFVALLPQHTLEQAERVGEQVRSVLEARQEREAGEKGLTVSVGCAEFGAQTAQAEGLLLAAELAVSRAKHLGRNRVCRFDSVPGADGAADPYQLHRFLQDSSFATIQALAAAVDAKDPYTQGHSQRVAQYASDLARAIGLPKVDVDLIYTTGTLHDVGKIGVPDAILKKPARLEDEERAIMETHPVLGEVIVRKAPQLAASLPGVRHHHERWDGKGYPDNLAGEDIPLMARILAVADTFDAMTSDRPYRKGLSLDVALGEITKGAGTQFDPRLTPVFVTMMQQSDAFPKAA